MYRGSRVRLIRNKEIIKRVYGHGSGQRQPWRWGVFVETALMMLVLFGVTGRSQGKYDDKKSAYGSFAIDLPASEADVLKAVEAVSSDDIIHGTQVYSREENLTGAEPATSSSYYGRWQGPGKVFYKVLTEALAPRHFKDSADVGTITVRYVVQGLSDKNTHLQIDAVFVQDGGHRVHASDGTVETSEFKEIQSRVKAMQLADEKVADAQKQRQAAEAAQAATDDGRNQEIERLDAAQTSVRNLQQRISELQHDIEVRVKDPGAELKAAPFHGAAKLVSLAGKTTVLVLIVTPYWYGVQTEDGRNGWLSREQVEPLP